MIGLTSNEEAKRFLDATLAVPAIGAMEPVVATVSPQPVASHVADHEDRPIDKPRNPAKSVTVE